MCDAQQQYSGSYPVDTALKVILSKSVNMSKTELQVYLFVIINKVSVIDIEQLIKTIHKTPSTCYYAVQRLKQMYPDDPIIQSLSFTNSAYVRNEYENDKQNSQISTDK